MKNKSIICALLLACGVGATTTSCEDMLSADSERTLHSNAGDTLYGYWGIMKAVQNLGERYVILGEARADLVYPTSYAADTISNIANFNTTTDGDCRFLEVKDYYTVINSCNNYLADVDSLKTNSSGYRVMEKEMAQVLAVRAWTYLQLVNNYGEVPYFTDPITSLGYVDNFDFSQAKNKLNRESLIAKLIPDLMPYKDVALPNYGSYNNGSEDIASTLTMFPMELVMGDIYLTGAQSTSDYEQAAQCYYDYLKDNGAYLPISLKTTASEGGGQAYYQNDGWTGIFHETASPVGKSYTGETITVIPSSAGKLYGSALTGISNLFGWSTSSQMNTDSEEGSEAEATTSASVSITGSDVTLRQLGPSQQYYSLCDDQDFVYEPAEGEKVKSYEYAGDARQYAAKDITTTVGSASQGFIMKPCVNYSFSYTFPIIYRKALVWLRYAEAINRAGFPSYAFAILKNGLCREYMPTEDMVIQNDTIDSTTIVFDTTYVYNTFNKVCSYIPESEFLKAKGKTYMDYNSDFTSLDGTNANNVGVHSRGCGEVGYVDSLYYTYPNMIYKKCVEMGRDTTNMTLADSINAVENLIVDELALETAWEGNRYPDLLRIASHKGDAGVQWFADKIARRGDTRDPNIDYTTTSEYLDLYNKLINKENWYLKLPSYK